MRRTVRPDERKDRIAAATWLVQREMHRGQQKFGDYASGHEAYAVILEELDELWNEIKSSSAVNSTAIDEAVQVAATALRFVVEFLPWRDVRDALQRKRALTIRKCEEADDGRTS